MSETVGDFVVNRLHAWGVDRVYGDPDAWDTVKQSIKGIAIAYRERVKELADRS